MQLLAQEQEQAKFTGEKSLLTIQEILKKNTGISMLSLERLRFSMSRICDCFQ
jgi:hypothetical protein